VENDLENFVRNLAASGRDLDARRLDKIRLAFKDVPQRSEQQLMIEWFREELGCTLFHGLSPYLGIVKRRNEDDGKVASFLFQPGLQFQTRHLRHANVNDQARCPAMQIGFEEGFG
jgi:hypothetical protein